MANRREQAFLKPLVNHSTVAVLCKLTYSRLTVGRSICESGRLQHSNVVFRLTDCCDGRRFVADLAAYKTQCSAFPSAFLKNVRVSSARDVSQMRKLRVTQKILEFVVLKTIRPCRRATVTTNRELIAGIHEHARNLLNRLAAFRQLLSSDEIDE